MPGRPFYPGPTGCAGQVGGGGGGTILSTALAESPSKADRPPPTDAANAIQDSRAYLGCGRGRVVVVATPPPLPGGPLEEGERGGRRKSRSGCVSCPGGLGSTCTDGTEPWRLGEIVVPRGAGGGSEGHKLWEDQGAYGKCISGESLPPCINLCSGTRPWPIFRRTRTGHGLSHGLKLIPLMQVANGEWRS